MVVPPTSNAKNFLLISGSSNLTSIHDNDFILPSVYYFHNLKKRKYFSLPLQQRFFAKMKIITGFGYCNIF